MKTPAKFLIVAAVAVAVVAAVALNKCRSPADGTPVVTAAAADTTSSDSAANTKLPKLLDLGAGKCIPCRMMAPILEELNREYAGRMSVEFIDVWKNPDAAKEYGIEVIPTQIFYDAEGKERFRHVGFFSKEDILGKWNELGVDLTGKSKSSLPSRKDTGASRSSAANEPKPQQSHEPSIKPGCSTKRGTVRVGTVLRGRCFAGGCGKPGHQVRIDSQDRGGPLERVVADRWHLRRGDPAKLNSYIETEVQKFLNEQK